MTFRLVFFSFYSTKGEFRFFFSIRYTHVLPANLHKSMEAEEAYGRTEVDKVLAKERDLTEMNQRLQYRVECLEGKLRQKNKAGKTGGQAFSIFHFTIRFF